MLRIRLNWLQSSFQTHIKLPVCRIILYHAIFLFKKLPVNITDNIQQ